MPYDVIETPGFLSQVEAIVGDIEKWDDAKWSGDWALEKNPTAGHYIQNSDSWALPFRTEPPVVVFYKVNQELRQVTPMAMFRFDISI